MKYFWNDVLEPTLAVLRPKSIVEVGAEAGGNTKNLVEWAKEHEAVLHSIDPVPGSPVLILQRENPETFILHRSLSLEALKEIERPDLVLIDGDHNWYTVNNELKLVARDRDRWPVTILHDIARPYGRRDMYYVPDNVPAEWRQPLRDAPGRPTAEKEGGPRNGVLTAIEDFLAASPFELELFAVPGPGGLGLLIERQQLDRDQDLAALVERVYDQQFTRTLTPDWASSYFA